MDESTEGTRRFRDEFQWRSHAGWDWRWVDEVVGEGEEPGVVGWFD